MKTTRAEALRRRGSPFDGSTSPRGRSESAEPLHLLRGAAFPNLRATAPLREVYPEHHAVTVNRLWHNPCVMA